MRNVPAIVQHQIEMRTCRSKLRSRPSSGTEQPFFVNTIPRPHGTLHRELAILNAPGAPIVRIVMFEPRNTESTTNRTSRAKGKKLTSIHSHGHNIHLTCTSREKELASVEHEITAHDVLSYRRSEIVSHGEVLMPDKNRLEQLLRLQHRDKVPHDPTFRL